MLIAPGIQRGILSFVDIKTMICVYGFCRSLLMSSPKPVRQTVALYDLDHGDVGGIHLDLKVGF